MPQDDSGLELYEILADHQRRGRPLLGQEIPAASAKDPAAVASRIKHTGKVQPIATPMQRLSGPMPAYAPNNKPRLRLPERRDGPAALSKPVSSRWPWRFAAHAAWEPAASDAPRPAAADALAPAEPASAPAWSERVRQSMSEIVIDINTAFFLFTAGLAAVSVAFILGYRYGRAESARARADLSGLGGGLEAAYPARRSDSPRPDEYVLLLKAYNEDADTQGYRGPEDVERLAGEVLRDLRARFGDRHDIAVFRDSANRARSLAVTGPAGGFRAGNDPGLEELAVFFRGYEGPRREERYPFRANQKPRAGQLGEFVPP